MPASLNELLPMLGVQDLQRTIAFYARLGFKVSKVFGTPPTWCDLYRDKVAIMFTQAPPSAITTDADSKKLQVFYFHPDNVTALHSEFKDKDLPVSNLRVTIYQMKEFTLEDPDGYQLWFGQPTSEKPTVTAPA